MGYPSYGNNNSAEQYAPKQNYWDVALHQARICNKITTLDHPTHSLLMGFFGYSGSKVAKVFPVVARKGYNGILPNDLQPMINKPEPWK